MSQSPSLRGSGRFMTSRISVWVATHRSQSPSLRGSGRFKKYKEVRYALTTCLNPLHCGAVVASRRREARRRAHARVSIPFIAGQWSLPVYADDTTAPAPCVSIPFIAGQWSLHGRRRPSPPAPPGLNPLHCGAVVASRRRRRRRRLRRQVSIPFIAGQWSLRGIFTQFRLRVDGSQSPSLRGSGRFEGPPGSPPATQCRLNPLHCGAVVASRGRLAFTPGRRHVSIPFIAGQWSLLEKVESDADASACLNPLHCGAVVASHGRPRRRRRPRWVSIPFIAGQWSLRPSPHGGGARRRRLNPLHCGAVVASRKGSRHRNADPSLNPLHCGAVVASCRSAGEALPARVVSIPFIAGQWSLPLAVAATTAVWRACLNPLHCGAVVASFDHHTADLGADRVSIPFIAGQWSLPVAKANGLSEAVMSQSPSLRGSGRFVYVLFGVVPALCRSQSPSLRGSGRFARRVWAPQRGG